MTMLRAAAMAFMTYSRVPMPKIKWDEKSSRYILCFFPLVGLLIGAVLFAVNLLCGVLNFGVIFSSAVTAVVPLLMTGGIHLDGFLDTVDALSSFAPKEKKLEILKDSNAGAFAVIYGCAWFLCYFSGLTELSGAKSSLIILSAGFVLTRGLSALAVLTFKSAREHGMGADMKKQSDKVPMIVSSVIWIALAAVFMLIISPVRGGVVLVYAALEFLHYRFKSYREFGGFTGDLAGWFVSRCELGICLVLALTERILSLWF